MGDDWCLLRFPPLRFDFVGVAVLSCVVWLLDTALPPRDGLRPSSLTTTGNSPSNCFDRLDGAGLVLLRFLLALFGVDPLSAWASASELATDRRLGDDDPLLLVPWGRCSSPGTLVVEWEGERLERGEFVDAGAK